MLKLNLNNTWTAASAESVVKLMLDGEVDRGTAASDPSVTDGEGPLERFLQPHHFDELAGEILRRIKSLYRSRAWGNDPHQLLDRLRALSTWGWSDELIRGRLFWITAWLEELTGSTEKAITYYSLYLAGDFPGTALRALALNNRGVLRVKLGQLEGVFDIAEVAIPNTDDAPEDVALPAACFNLLNLLNAASRSDVLSAEMQNIMGRYLYKISPGPRETWVGKLKRPGNGAESRRSYRRRKKRYRSRSAEGNGGGNEELAVMPSELVRDLTRLNRITCRLAKIAQGLAPPVGMVDPDTFVDRELQLWGGRNRDDVAGTGSARLSHAMLETFAEGASLLFASDIPPTLTAKEASTAWPRRLIEEGLVRAENYMERNAFDLAESTLRGAKAMAVSRLDANAPETEAMQQTIDALTARLVERRRDVSSLRIHEQCVEFDQLVNNFCKLRDYPTAKREVIDLQNRVSALTREILEHEDWGGEALTLVEDHVRRADIHLANLETADRSEKVRLPVARLRRLWPQSWDEPVPVSAFEALTQCQALDPNSDIEDWELVRKKLHHHQAQYYFQRVLRSLELGKIDRQRIKRELELAVRQDPEIEASAEPILLLLEESHEEADAGDVEGLHERLALLRKRASPVHLHIDDTGFVRNAESPAATQGTPEQVDASFAEQPMETGAVSNDPAQGEASANSGDDVDGNEIDGEDAEQGVVSREQEDEERKR